MKKKPYIKPSAVLLQFSTTERLADEVIISTSTATVIGEEGGELNAPQATLFEDELNGSDEEFIYKPIHSLWDDEE